MYTVNDNGMIYVPQPPVFRQVVALVFGLVFVFSNGYSGLQLVGAAVCAPLCFAGAIRLYTGAYRLVFSLLPIMWVAVVVGFSAIGIVTSFLLVPAFQHSDMLGGILTVILMLCEAVVFVWDVKRWRALHKT